MSDGDTPRDDADARTDDAATGTATDGGRAAGRSGSNDRSARRAARDDSSSDSAPTASGSRDAASGGAASDEPLDDVDPAVLQARVDVLARENDRLREEYVRARRTQYRRSAFVLGLFGLLAVAGAAVFVEYRELLLALGGTGLFGAVLTYYLTPERFVAATVAERVHAAHAATQQGLLDDLGLADERVYVPTPGAPHPVRLFVPQRPEYDLPAEPERVLLVPEEPSGRGVALVPTGALLFEEFEATVTGEPADDPATLAAQLADAVVETFELAAAASVDPDARGDRAVLSVSEPLYGDLDVPDHPVVSVVGAGLAVGLEEPVTATVSYGEDEGRVVFDWSDAAR